MMECKCTCCWIEVQCEWYAGNNRTISTRRLDSLDLQHARSEFRHVVLDERARSVDQEWTHEGDQR